MVAMNIELDNFLIFNDFKLNLSYAKKTVHSTIVDEHLHERNNFRYRKLIILMGANATGKTALSRVLMGIYNFIAKKDVLALAKWSEENGTRLVVDESFVDFSHGYEENTLLDDRILETFPHLVVMKSISKSYGVPGIRLGILCSADKALIAKMKKTVSIWNLNSFAEFFMQIYTKYEKDYKIACEQFITERDRFGDELRQVKFLRVMPSEANYFLCEILPPFTANGLVLAMLKKYNILMRDCSDKKGLDGKQYMRIAVRSREDNARLIKAFKELEAGATV